MAYLEYNKSLKSYKTFHHTRETRYVNKIQGEQGKPYSTRAFRKYLNFFVTRCNTNIHNNNSNYNNNEIKPCLIHWYLQCCLPEKQDCSKGK